MKQIYSKLVLLIAMILVGSSAWADDVTFTFKTDEDITYTKTGTSGGGAECIVSKSDVTLSGTNAYTESTKSLTVYAKSTLTINAPGNITAIALEYNGKVYPFDEAVGDGTKGSKFAASGAHPATYAPATPSTSVTLTNPNGGKTELISLKVTYTAGTVVKVTGVSLDASSKELTEGGSFTLAATVAPANASNQLITWSSSDNTVATVSKDGEVAALTPGTAIITVQTVDGSYKASCEVTVTEAPEPDEYVFLFTPANADDDSSSSLTATTALNKAFTEGAQYISSITAERVYPARNSLGYGVKFGTSSAAGNITINLKKAVPATYVVVSAAAYGDTEGQQGFTVNGVSVAMPASQNKVYCDYVVKLDGSDLTTITLTQNKASKGRIYVQYVKVIKEDAPYYGVCTRKLTAKDEDGTYYATFSSDKVTFFQEDYIVSAVGVEDGQLYTCSNGEAFDEDILDVDGESVTGYYVPANTGVLIESAEPLVEYYTAEDATPSTDVESINMLRPASAAMEGDFKFYKLAYDDAETKTDLGFYYGAEDGAAFNCNSGLAYLAVPTGIDAKVRGFVLNSEATAITSVSASSKSAKCYNLQGQQVSADYKGIVISNGKKFYNK